MVFFNILLKPNTFRAPATKVRQNLSIVAKNENSTEHLVHLHAEKYTLRTELG